MYIKVSLFTQKLAIQSISEKVCITTYIQVIKKFHKFERVYRDCIKRTRDKTRIHCIPHDAPGT